MRKVEVEVVYKYTLEIDDNNSTVKEYENDQELIEDCAYYQFGKVLPVIENGGVNITEIEFLEIEI